MNAKTPATARSGGVAADGSDMDETNRDTRHCADIGCRTPIKGQVEYVLQVSTGHVRWFCDVDCVVNGKSNHERALSKTALGDDELMGTGYWLEADTILAERQEQTAAWQAEHEARLAKWAAEGTPSWEDYFATPVLRTNHEGHLLCPECGSEWTHMDTVMMVVGNRKKVVSVNHQGVVDIEAVLPGEIRTLVERHLAVLVLNCEECGGNSYISLRQHKGNTEVEYVYYEHDDLEDRPVPALETALGMDEQEWMTTKDE